MILKVIKNGAIAGNVYVLLSGGIDSAACVAFYLEQGFSVQGIFIDYGQVAAQREADAAKAIARHFNILFDRVAWSGLHKKGAGLICGRNAFLLIAALMELPECAGILALGIHSGTEYIDCTPAFVQKMQSILDIYTQGRIQIGAPFLKWAKQEIWKYCKYRGVPLELTYSCEYGIDQPCGKCLSCRDLEVLYACT
jgi:7-cyano-7-deazaguanine synthase